MAKPDKSEFQRRPMVEWVIGALSAVMVLALLGFLAIEGIARAPGEPRFRVEILAIEQAAEGIAARIEVINEGEAAAAAVTVEGTTASGQHASIQFDYIAGHGRRRGVLYFPDGNGAGLEIHVSGHVMP